MRLQLGTGDLVFDRIRSMSDNPPLLPHGAIGLESDEFVIEFRGGKIIFIPKDGSGRHFTFQLTTKSGVMDLHETTDNGDGCHKTLFAIEKNELSRMLAGLKPMGREFIGLFRRLRVGWLNHHHIGIARGFNPVTDDEIARVTRVLRKKRLTLDEDAWRANVIQPEFLDEVWDFPDGQFTLGKKSEQIGIGFKQTTEGGQPRLYWIKLRDLESFNRRWHVRIEQAMQSAAIPKENYSDYPFLKL